MIKTNAAQRTFNEAFRIGAIAGLALKSGFDIVLFLALIAAALLLAPIQSASAITNTTFTTSTTHHETDTIVTLPGVTVVTPPGPLQNQLSQILVGPNGALVLNALNSVGVLGPATTTLVGQVFVGTNTTVTSSHAVGPATIVTGPDLSQSFFVAAGTDNFNFNTAFESFFNNLFQSAQPLSNRGVNWLSGDLHTTFQTTILDGDFRFTDMLLSRGRNAGAGPGITGPSAFAAEAAINSPIEEALAYAGTGRMATKATPLAAINGLWSAWIAGEGGRNTVGGTANNFGFSYRTASGAGGLEWAKGSWLFGAAAGFGAAKVRQDTTLDSGTVDTAQGGLYGAWRPGPYTLSAALTYAHHSIDATRLTLFPGPALSSYDADSFGGGLEISTRRPLLGGTVEPLAGLVYNALRTNGFTENGPFLALAGNAATVAALKGYAGARLWQTFDVGTMQVTPELRGRVLYDMLDDTRGFSASFIADPARVLFPVTGIQPNRLSERLGAGVNIRFNPMWRASLNYDAELRGGDVGHFVSGTIRATW